MPDMWLDVDTAVAIPVNILALTDDSDFKSRKTTITYDEAGMHLVWNFVTSAGVMTQTAVTPTTGGMYDWTHVGDGMYKIGIPASGGGDINNDTEGYGWFTGVCDGVLPWRSPVFGFRAADTNDKLCDVVYTVTLADGAQGGSSTVLTLSRLVVSGSHADGVVDIDNSGGSAIKVNGSISGVIIDGASGDGVSVRGETFGISAKGYNCGIEAEGLGSGTGIVAGGVTGVKFDGTSCAVKIVTFAGPGVQIAGTTFGVEVAASAGVGVQLDGTLAGVHARGGTTGNGIVATGGSTSGNGIVAEANAAGSGVGLQAIGIDDNPGISAAGAGTGSGVYCVGGVEGHGLYAYGGSTSGDGLHAAAQGSGDGLAAALTSTECDAIATAILDLASAIDTETLREAIRIIAAATAGKLTGAGGSTETAKGLDGTTTRAVASVDEDGNRNSVTYY